MALEIYQLKKVEPTESYNSLSNRVLESPGYKKQIANLTKYEINHKKSLFRYITVIKDCLNDQQAENYKEIINKKYRNLDCLQIENDEEYQIKCKDYEEKVKNIEKSLKIYLLLKNTIIRALSQIMI